MRNSKTTNANLVTLNNFAHPPGRIKIANAFRELLMEKDFNSITTAEIARSSGVNEALIYRYFKDKRGLLYQILAEHLEDFVLQVKIDLKGIKGAINKLRKYVWSTIHFLDKDRVLAKMLMLESRNHSNYFESSAYQLIKNHAKTVLEIVEEGVSSGEIRDDISPKSIRQTVLGSVEHLCLLGVIFNREIDVDSVAEDLCEILFQGIEKNKEE